MTDETPFASYADLYKKAGYWVRPLKGKRPFLENWQKPDPFFPGGTFETWIEKYANCNLGLVSGSPFPDGTCLGFFDIDSDLYTRLGKVIFNRPVCTRIGKKGLVIPVRYRPGLSVSKKIKVKGKDNGEEIAEFLLDGAICAIPPSIHPDTGQPYRWEGPSLLDINFQKLPIIGE